MEQSVSFIYPRKGFGRPQILLIGNGLEYKSGQCSWEQLVKNLTLPEKRGLCGTERLPFPLRYELISTPKDVPNPMGRKDILQEERRLADAMKNMVHKSNPLLERLPKLQMDHIFTTNYSYCLEQAFFPRHNFARGQIRSKFRFDLREEAQKEGKTREVQSGCIQDIFAHSKQIFPGGQAFGISTVKAAYPMASYWGMTAMDVCCLGSYSVVKIWRNVCPRQKGIRCRFFPGLVCFCLETYIFWALGSMSVSLTFGGSFAASSGNITGMERYIFTINLHLIHRKRCGICF